ncbi:MAG: 3-deoxy-7-phosphoheptulonate synthase [Lentisphaeria bacterium]|nr:3-deoxy-7-phosphoheptulonate synthase [Lentisphaeria bacterium]
MSTFNQLNNINIKSVAALPSPEEIRLEHQLSIDAGARVVASRQEAMDILDGRSRRLMVIAGPCSIHNPASAIRYAEKLKALSDRVSDHLMILMRCYFEKPRTTVGWKGLLSDPGLDDSCDIARGIRLSRDILTRVVEVGLPVATEILDPVLAQYIADCITWTAIGARTTEAQTHRQLASGLSMPVGFKNATDGATQTAIDAVLAARSHHSFIGVLEDGSVGVFRTKGNPYAHIVMRGGNNHTNYGPEYVAYLRVVLQRAGLPTGIVIDCSHANSGKDYRKQHVALDGILGQIAEGEDAIRGVMLESNLKPGSQKVVAGVEPDPEISITDGCIGWEETEELILKTWETVKKARF